MSKPQENTIFLSSEDGVILAITKKAISQSKLIYELVRNLGPNATKQPIPVKYVSSSMLRKVIIYLEHHANDPIFGDWDDDDDDEISDWDKSFLGNHYPTISHLNLVAVHLRIKQLSEITFKTCQKMTRGMSPEDLRRFYDNQDSWTFDDEERLYQN